MNLYSNLRKNPFVRILFPYVIGILFAKAFSMQFPNYLFQSIAGLFLLLGIVLYTLFLKLELKLTDFLIPALVFSASILHYTLNISVLNNQHENLYVVGRVLQTPIEKQSSYLLKVKQLHPLSPRLNKPCVNLYTDKDSAVLLNVEPGAVISFRGDLEPIKNRGNPDEFDFALYQATRGYYSQGYIPFSDIIINQKKDLVSQVILLINNIRSGAKQIINENFESETAQGIVAALILGDKSEINEDLRSKFADAGVVHVLAISGLHIGILYMLLSFILKPLQYRNKLRVVRIVVILLCIWFYAGLTGFSSSVTRATVMFTLIAFGNSLKREISIYNTIAASAFLLLLINPLLLFDVGFQLSYAAVVGIVYFYPVFYSFFKFKNWIFDYPYKLLCVSFAAQLSTMPLTIYYFNQFPNYFWLANLIVIPAVFLILFMGIILLVTAKISFIAKVFSLLIKVVIGIMNSWIDIVTEIPYSTLKALNLHLGQAVLLLIAIYLTFVWIKNKKAVYLLGALSIIPSILLISIYYELNRGNDSQIIFYNSYQGNNIGLYYKNEHVLFTDLSEENRNKLTKYYFERHWLINHSFKDIEVRELEDPDISENLSATQIIHIKDNISILYINSKIENISRDNALSTQYIYIGKEIFPPRSSRISGTIVISSSVNNYYAKKWEEFALRNNLDCHNIEKEGALIVNL